MKTNPTTSTAMTVYPAQDQGKGAFDGGRITEIKPIPFPHEYGGSKRIGPLLYWAWATAHGDGVIGMHPHQGFEIMSYVLEGSVGHTDSAGNSSRVSAGGAQVMQTGSGISHQEEMHGERTDFFQIWFEPNMREALRKTPVYADYNDGDFPVTAPVEGVSVKQIIGGESPNVIDAPAQVDDITVAAGAGYTVRLPAHHALATMMISGDGTWTGEGLDGDHAVESRAFALVKSGADLELTLTAGESGARLMNVVVPISVDYPLQF